MIPPDRRSTRGEFIGELESILRCAFSGDDTGSLDSETFGATKIVREEELSPEAFLALFRREPSAIKRVRIVPPRVGGRRMGKIVVEYVMPRLRKR